MLYRLGDVELDLHRWEVRRNGIGLAAEPQVLAVLFHLIQHPDRVVTKDELVLSVWDGRAISDAAISSRIKSARQLIGDDGKAQRLIRTVHGKGYRFVGPAHVDGQEVPSVASTARYGKPSLIVLPFASGHPDLSILADGLPHELIAGLSRLGSLLVIARGSSFRFRRTSLDPLAIGALLGVDYVLRGEIHGSDKRLVLAVHLVATSDGAVVWGESFDGQADDPHALRSAVLTRLLATLDLRIARHEAERARHLPNEQLDAWSLYHLGLEHAFRFTRHDNAIALDHFERAIAAQPDFARAHAAVSFARFQNAFMHYGPDDASNKVAARRHADLAVQLDDQDPTGHLMVGRARWLYGEVEEGLPWIEKAIVISPNYAQAIYSRAWSEMILAESGPGQYDARQAILRSPLDPLNYAMMAIDGFTESQLGDPLAGAVLVDRAARQPRAHVMIAVMAAICNLWCGRDIEARRWMENVKVRDPSLTSIGFLASFPFRLGVLREKVCSTLADLGL